MEPHAKVAKDAEGECERLGRKKDISKGDTALTGQAGELIT